MMPMQTAYLEIVNDLARRRLASGGSVDFTRQMVERAIANATERTPALCELLKTWKILKETT